MACKASKRLYFYSRDTDELNRERKVTSNEEKKRGIRTDDGPTKTRSRPRNPNKQEKSFFVKTENETKRRVAVEKSRLVFQRVSCF